MRGDKSDCELRFIAETSLPTHKGRYRMRAYRDVVTSEEPMALLVGDVEGRDELLVRVHDQCMTSEVIARTLMRPNIHFRGADLKLHP